jgi:hypothetical protein
MVILFCWCCSSSVWQTVRLYDSAIAWTSEHTIDRTQRTTASQDKSTNTVRCTHGFAICCEKAKCIVADRRAAFLFPIKVCVQQQHVLMCCSAIQ